MSIIGEIEKLKLELEKSKHDFDVMVGCDMRNEKIIENLHAKIKELHGGKNWLTEMMKELFIDEKYADNGQLSHYALIRKSDGKIIFETGDESSPASATLDAWIS